MASASSGTSASVTVAVIAAIATIIAAFIAAWSARSARRSDEQAARAKELENRLAEQKFQTYKPMLELLRDLLDTEKSKNLVDNPKVKETLTDFITWIGIFGSDKSVEAFHNFMQAAYNSPPPEILMRFYGELVIAARQDIAYPETKIKAVHILGMKMNDLYSQDIANALTLPADEAYKKFNWQPPWLTGESDDQDD